MTQHTQPRTETWQVDTTAAEVYEELFVPTLFRGAAESLLRTAGVGAGEAVLDVGCGTGVVSRLAADHVGPDGRVVGYDLNEGMLAVARRIAPEIEWCQGDATALPFEDGVFDLVLSQFALMFFTDRQAALREMLRVIRPGGRAVVSVWSTLERNPAFAALVRIAEERFGEGVSSVLASPFEIGDRDRLLDLVRSAGATGVELETEPCPALFPSVRSWLYTEVKASPIASRLDERALERFVEEIEPRFEFLAERDGRARIVLSAHTVVARR